MTKSLHFENIQDGEAQLRTVVAAIDREMSILSGTTMRDGAHAAQGQLLASWAALVQLLAIGPLPETRACPACHHVGMANATRCGYCWAKLSALPGAAPVQ
jgi:hypothetical protein